MHVDYGGISTLTCIPKLQNWFVGVEKYKEGNVVKLQTSVRASAMQLGKAHCKPKPILLKIAQNLEGVHQILLKNGKILPHSL